MSSVLVVQGDRFANEPEDFSVGFKAGFSYFVPYEFLFCEKHLGDFFVAPKALWI